MRFSSYRIFSKTVLYIKKSYGSDHQKKFNVQSINQSSSPLTGNTAKLLRLLFNWIQRINYHKARLELNKTTA